MPTQRARHSLPRHPAKSPVPQGVERSRGWRRRAQAPNKGLLPKRRSVLCAPYGMLRLEV